MIVANAIDATTKIFARIRRAGIANTSRARRKYAGLQRPSTNAKTIKAAAPPPSTINAMNRIATARVSASADHDANWNSAIGRRAVAAMMLRYEGAIRIASAISTIATARFAIRPA